MTVFLLLNLTVTSSKTVLVVFPLFSSWPKSEVRSEGWGVYINIQWKRWWLGKRSIWREGEVMLVDIFNLYVRRQHQELLSLLLLLLGTTWFNQNIKPTGYSNLEWQSMKHENEIHPFSKEQKSGQRLLYLQLHDQFFSLFLLYLLHWAYMIIMRMDEWMNEFTRCALVTNKYLPSN